MDAHRDEITQSMHDEVSIDQILRNLETEHHITVSKPTLERRLKEWGLQSSRYHVCAGPELRKALIIFYFYQRLATDPEIIRELQTAGLPTTIRQLRRIRVHMGIGRRRELQDPGYIDAEIIRVMKEHLVLEGAIQDYGRAHLYTCFRRRGITISQHDIMFAMRKIDHEGVSARLAKKNRKWKKFLVAGPDAIWSIDAHCKLEFCGIQIYAVIDAYSRKLLWIYVGVSSRTAVSVAKQFLTYLQDEKIMPHKIRSDRALRPCL